MTYRRSNQNSCCLRSHWVQKSSDRQHQLNSPLELLYFGKTEWYQLPLRRVLISQHYSVASVKPRLKRPQEIVLACLLLQVLSAWQPHWYYRVSRPANHSHLSRQRHHLHSKEDLDSEPKVLIWYLRGLLNGLTCAGVRVFPFFFREFGLPGSPFWSIKGWF